MLFFQPPFRKRLALKLAKSANINNKHFFNWNWVSQNARFDAEFESVEKIYLIEVIGRKPLHTEIKIKYQIFCCSYLFLGESFATFSPYSKSVSNF
jgi:hypothetical protein